MDETPGDATPSGDATGGGPDAPPRRRTRRWFVAGGLALVVGGAAGVAADYVRGRPVRSARPAMPAALHDALQDERRLVALAEIARRQADGDLPAALLEALVRDHRAHLAGLTAAAESYAAPRHQVRAGHLVGDDRASLRKAEQRAARRAGERATQLHGDTAALLASIAACEATHAELLA
ncbi:hypothetical protein [Jatrophihabitans endophyticus]|uniref:hypothetical protein n=1 Tax=Jatrophihabitans endophyticus TaxID=1206085 RepID=UPI0019E18924|nr:hypothetical protein [Jatrophihabitans endophyticus]MBE7187780.1 hypothetical protein [Jatrophihabitans endophyticus]